MRRCLPLAVALLLCPVVLSHSDDPKILDRQPRYEGPGWRMSDGLRGSPSFDSSGITLLSWISLPDFGSFSSGNDCWGYVSPSGREYALMGLNSGTAFVEITDPGDPQIIAIHSGPDSVWRDIKVYQQYAYVVSEGGSGIQVFDMGGIDNGVVTFVRTVLTGGASATHNVAIDTESGFLYRTGGDNNGLRIYSLADPSNPSYVAAWTTRYVHDCQAVTYTEGPYAGKQIVFACSGFNGGWDNTGLDILDVTNKSNIVVLGRIEYSTPGYSHQGWLSPDRQYFYLDDELDEYTYGFTTRARVIDVSDLSNPVEVATYTNGSTAIDHNLYVTEDYIFAANYRSGLRVFDRSDPIAPVEVAWFDTYPGSNSANFNGLWSNYPYFPSGTIIGSDIERGLFVWRLDLQRLSITFPAGQPQTVSPAGGTPLIAGIAGQFGAELEPGTATLFVDVGDGFEPVAMSPLSGDEFEGHFPAADCGTTVRYFVSAESTDGAVFTSPPNAPSSYFTALAAGALVVHLDEPFESPVPGWSVNPDGTDTATAGMWTRMIPEATPAQPGEDHTPPPGVMCWVTDGRAGGSIGQYDVDNGHTTLRSPAFDLSGMNDPRISYWRWYSNDQGAAPNTDQFVVDISSDNGQTWTNVETIGPFGPGTSGGWFYHEFRVADLVATTSQVRLRFIASDEPPGSIVEAAIDDLMITDHECPPDCPYDLDGDGEVGLGDLSILLSNFGLSGVDPEQGDLDGDGEVSLGDLSILLSNFGLPC